LVSYRKHTPMRWPIYFPDLRNITQMEYFQTENGTTNC